MKTYVVDTHALIWYFDGDTRLSRAAQRALESRDATLVVPTVVLAEISHLFAKKRIRLSFEIERFGLLV